MPSENEMEQATAQLNEFRADRDRHNTTLTEMLDKYTTLIEDYKRLRSDYEEERDSRERYKQMARGQERNPFVLLLIDADGYIFDDDLVSSGAEGGQRAAHLLNQAVKDSLRTRGLEHCKVMVRLYANLNGLSKALSKSKLAGPEKRSLSTFVANFNRSNELFDFVDAGELKENADFKIRAMFRLFAENPQCRHIFFAGCHDVGYISELTPYIGNRDRITLVRTYAFHQEFSKLGFRTETFPDIFRSSPLEMLTQASYKAPVAQNATPVLASPTKETGNICAFYQKGQCKYGSGCRFLHLPKNTANGNLPEKRASPFDGGDWRQNGNGTKQDLPFRMPNLAKSDNDFMSGNHTSQAPPYQPHSRSTASLPRSDEIPPGTIPVNKAHHRLDVYIPSPSQEAWAAFESRKNEQKLCNNFHLTGQCHKMENCSYDHSPASPEVLQCLSLVARSLSCPRRGRCRSLACAQAHVCQKADCKYRGGRAICKLHPTLHTADLEVASYVYPEGGFADTNSSQDQRSTPSMADAGSDEEKEEGAPLDINDDDSLD